MREMAEMTIRRAGRAVAGTAAALVAFVAWAPIAVAQAEEAEAAPAEQGSPVAQPESWPVEEAAAPAPAPAPTPGALSGDAPDYEIGAADVVRVMVWRNPELSTEVPVRPDGRISVPLLGDIQAAGFTTATLRDRIAEGLSEFITAPDVTVTVAQVNSKVVYLVGEVVRPTALPLNRDMRVLDAIALAGGFSPFADKGDIKVLRPLADGSVEEHEFNYGKFVKGKKPESNLLLRPGDTIVVPD
jgi:polysaccharide export outer membrane protein